MENEMLLNDDSNFKIRMYTRIPNFRSNYKDVNYYSDVIKVKIEMGDPDENQYYVISTDWDNYNDKMTFCVNDDLHFVYHYLENVVKIAIDAMKYEIVTDNYQLFAGTTINMLHFKDIGVDSTVWFKHIFTKRYFNNVAKYYSKGKRKSIPQITCKSNRDRDSDDEMIFIGDFSENIYTVDVKVCENKILFNSSAKDSYQIFTICVARPYNTIGSVIERLLSYYDDIKSLDGLC